VVVVVVQQAGVVDVVDVSGEIVVFQRLLVYAAEHEAALLHQDRDAAAGHHIDADAVAHPRSRVWTRVSLDARRAAGSAAEQPGLDGETALRRAQGESAVERCVSREALTTPDDVADDALLALLAVEQVHLAGAVGADAEDPREVARDDPLAGVVEQLSHVTRHALVLSVHVELVDGASQARS